MNELEKVEVLRERANVTYEEAREALVQSGGDLLEAMVLLERQGKTNAPKQNVNVPAVYVAEEKKEKKKSVFTKIKDVFRTLWKKGNDNYFCVTRNEEITFKLPAWVFALIVLCTWELTLVIMIIGLFVGYKFTFIGKDDLRGVNTAFDKASDFVYQVKEEFR